MNPITQIADYKKARKPNFLDISEYGGPWIKETSEPDALGLYHDKRHVEGAKRVVDKSRVIRRSFHKKVTEL